MTMNGNELRKCKRNPASQKEVTNLHRKSSFLNALAPYLLIFATPRDWIIGRTNLN
jgi:hypothetical protein